MKLPISNFKFLEFIVGDDKTDCSFQFISTYSLKNYGVCSFMNPETGDGINNTTNNSIEIFGIKYINDTTLKCTYSTFFGINGWVNLWKIVGFN